MDKFSAIPEPALQGYAKHSPSLVESSSTASHGFIITKSGWALSLTNALPTIDPRMNPRICLFSRSSISCLSVPGSIIKGKPFLRISAFNQPVDPCVPLAFKSPNSARFFSKLSVISDKSCIIFLLYTNVR